MLYCLKSEDGYFIEVGIDGRMAVQREGITLMAWIQSLSHMHQSRQLGLLYCNVKDDMIFQQRLEKAFCLLVSDVDVGLSAHMHEIT